MKKLVIIVVMFISTISSAHDICGGALYKMSNCLSFQYESNLFLQLPAKIKSGTDCTDKIKFYNHGLGQEALEIRREYGIADRVTDSFDTQEYGSNLASRYECAGKTEASGKYLCVIEYEVQEHRYHGDPTPEVEIISLDCNN